MSKKHLNTDSLLNELKGNSSFFPARHQDTNHHEQPPLAPPPATTTIQEKTALPASGITIPRYHDTVIPSTHDTTIPVSEDDMVEAVRKAVKQIGKEPATQRLTLEEKQALDAIEYSYKRQGIKTSGNEIIRIATNYIVRDYRKNGEQSILAKVLHRLNF